MSILRHVTTLLTDLVAASDGYALTWDNATGKFVLVNSIKLAKKRIETATTTEVAGDQLIVANKPTAMTVNLLAATGSGRVLHIKNIGAGAVTVDGDSGDTIDSETTQVLNLGDSMTLVDYVAGGWVII